MKIKIVFFESYYEAEESINEVLQELGSVDVKDVRLTSKWGYILYDEKGKPTVKRRAKVKEGKVKETKPKATETDWYKQLQDNPAYKHINLEKEAGKMNAWLSLDKNKNRSCTKRFVLNWLNNSADEIIELPKTERVERRPEILDLPEVTPEKKAQDLAKVKELMKGIG